MGFNISYLKLSILWGLLFFKDMGMLFISNKSRYDTYTTQECTTIKSASKNFSNIVYVMPVAWTSYKQPVILLEGGYKGQCVLQVMDRYEPILTNSWNIYWPKRALKAG